MRHIIADITFSLIRIVDDPDVIAAIWNQRDVANGTMSIRDIVLAPNFSGDAAKRSACFAVYHGCNTNVCRAVWACSIDASNATASYEKISLARVREAHVELIRNYIENGSRPRNSADYIYNRIVYENVVKGR